MEKAVRNYCFGALAPTQNVEMFWAEVYGQHRYRNKLVELERQRRDEASAILRQHCPEIPVLEEAAENLDQRLQAAITDLRATNQQARRQAATRSQRESVAELRTRLREVRARLKELRTQTFASSSIEQDLQAANDAHEDRVRQARGHCGLYWGNYLQVEEAAKSFRKGPPPNFQRRDRGGKIAVQIQNGMTLEQALSGTDTRFRIVPSPGPAGRNPDSRRSQKNRTVTYWLRIGSAHDGKRANAPVWLVLPGQFHRQLPLDLRIKWVFAHCDCYGTEQRWKVRIVGETMEERRGAREGAVGIDLGWRLLESGVRVAYWHASDGATGELILPMRRVTRWEHADSLRAIRDRNFDTIRRQIVEWVESGAEVPDWFVAQTATMGQWRSHGRLVSLLHGYQHQGQHVPGWNEQRIPGDEAIHALVTAWQAQDEHLWNWEAFERRKAVNWRKDTFRVFVKQLRERYRTAYIEDIDWSVLARRPLPESTDPIIQRARYMQRVAAPGELARYITEGFHSTVRVEPANTTLTCAHCGSVEEIDRFQLRHQCSCGVTWDQDANASKNILDAGQALPADAGAEDAEG